MAEDLHVVRLIIAQVPKLLNIIPVPTLNNFGNMLLTRAYRHLAAEDLLEKPR